METRFDYNQVYYTSTNMIKFLNYRDDDSNIVYFTDRVNIPLLLLLDSNIYEIMIPEDAEVKKSKNLWYTQRYLIKRFYDASYNIEKWFDKEEYNYKDYSFILPLRCSEKFYTWFDKERYNYEKDSWALAKYCQKYFDVWFDKELYNYDLFTRELVAYCLEHHNKWFDKRLCNCNNVKLLRCKDYGNEF